VPSYGELRKTACVLPAQAIPGFVANLPFSVARHFFGFFLVGTRKKLAGSRQREHIFLPQKDSSLFRPLGLFSITTQL